MKLDRDRLLLHAVCVSLPGYFGETKPPLMIQAPLPDYFDEATELLKLTFPTKNNFNITV